jgi:iron complex transport system permease protein
VPTSIPDEAVTTGAGADGAGAPEGASTTDARPSPEARLPSPPRHSPLVFAALVIGLLAAMTVSVSWGQLSVPPLRVWQLVSWHVFGWPDPDPSWTAVQNDVVWNLRVPRVLLAAVVGAGLTTVGVIVQTLVRNPLAEPWTLGVSQGAAVGAVATIVLGIGVFGGGSASTVAFAGALAAMLLVYAFARRGGEMVPLRLVLAGVAVGWGFYGVAHYLVLLADNPGDTHTALFWLLGGLGGAEWDNLAVPAVVLALVLILLVGQARLMNALLVGDETAASLGINVERWRRVLLVLASALTGVMVAVSGSIGFVGLVVPHAMRLLVGGDHRRLVAAAAVGGAAFLVLADLVARMALDPQELPIGVVTALVGTPTFLALMHVRRLGSTV